MNKLQTVLDALEKAKRQVIHSNVAPHGCINEAIAIVKEMMAQEPVAWADDNAMQGKVGNVCSTAAKRYWEKSDLVDKKNAELHKHPLYAAPVAVQAVPAVCEWTQDTQYENGDTYYSACGKAWVFNDGGPTDNRVSYCHHCGKKVQLAAAPVAKVEM